MRGMNLRTIEQEIGNRECAAPCVLTSCGSNHWLRVLLACVGAAIAVTALGGCKTKNKDAKAQGGGQVQRAEEQARAEQARAEEARRQQEQMRLAVRDKVTGKMASRMPLGVGSLEMDETPVTVAAYKACVDAGACTAAHADTLWEGKTGDASSRLSQACNWGKPGREKHPINCVDWGQAKAFCLWAEKRLPTHDEWKNENVDESQCLQRQAEFTGTREVSGSPQGSVLPAPLSFCGSVSEWTDTQVTALRDGGKREEFLTAEVGWSEDKKKVLASPVFSALPPDTRSSWLGFRCARGYWKREGAL
jgi:hypothetical protein